METPAGVNPPRWWDTIKEVQDNRRLVWFPFVNFNEESSFHYKQRVVRYCANGGGERGSRMHRVIYHRGAVYVGVGICVEKRQ